MMNEKDWKIFKKVKALALERFCESALEEFNSAMNHDDMTSHEKYIYLYKLVENTDKRLALLFDGNSRSSASIQLTLIRREKLVDSADLEGMSEEFLESTKS